NSACTCCIMDSKGTIYGRRFLRLPSETDRLNHAVNRIKKPSSMATVRCRGCGLKLKVLTMT
ncbi:hypothetical protein, partial [Butyrivibrio fibrisolvens]|uniref:hypothetical protein n=1 Tax=Butyrivibrio fibrisolvens TaxID=831 RepID=UPI001A99D3EA